LRASVELIKHVFEITKRGFFHFEQPLRIRE
jgi:hypothetical protein